MIDNMPFTYGSHHLLQGTLVALLLALSFSIFTHRHIQTSLSYASNRREIPIKTMAHRHHEDESEYKKRKLLEEQRDFFKQGGVSVEEARKNGVGFVYEDVPVDKEAAAEEQERVRGTLLNVFM